MSVIEKVTNRLFGDAETRAAALSPSEEDRLALAAQRSREEEHKEEVAAALKEYVVAKAVADKYDIRYIRQTGQLPPKASPEGRSDADAGEVQHITVEADQETHTVPVHRG